MRGSAPLLISLILLGACESGTAPPPPSPPPAQGPVRFVTAGAGEVPPLVLAAAQEAAGEHRRLLVYVGAVWCKPCVAFHDAATRGELDAALPGLTLLAFDSDLDQDRLTAAGYDAPLIPLFAVPGADGRATSRMSSGAKVGGNYVAELVPRVQALLAP